MSLRYFLTFELSVQPPRDILVVYVDDESTAQLVNTDGFTDVTLGLSPGSHSINFSYEYNPFNLALEGLGPSPPERLGAAWVDSVTIETTGNRVTRLFHQKSATEEKHYRLFPHN